MKCSNNFYIHLLLYSFLKTSRCASIIKQLFLTYYMLRLQSARIYCFDLSDQPFNNWDDSQEPKIDIIILTLDPCIQILQTSNPIWMEKC